MERKYLDFEKPLEEIEKQILSLQEIKKRKNVDNQLQITQLQQLFREKTKEIYSNLTPWQKVQIARHPQRPHTLDYISGLIENFYELHGDRICGDDPAIIAGIGKFRGLSLAVIGHQKGKDTEENIRRNFGMAHPEGYRKALRVMKIAEKFSFPIITLVDTPGAHPHIEAEERNQALAIANNLYEMSGITTPVIVVIIGEGGSGGALGIGVGDKILMLEFAIYSVISPEGCASILWKNQNAVVEASESLKLTAPDLLNLGLIDEIVPEPQGGAHSQPQEMIKTLGDYIEKNLNELHSVDIKFLMEKRYQKYRNIGFYKEKQEII
ncbi:MAG TPA: acetyl-CoA carboxylase carboxyltransferase subunit alpha [bacterium]|nr:acetyl-CoA carboxylase carboxyltransferase subunit alpha [bacterium]HOL34299.1 acetyl-CoA carboxylase carboxyltransferase subunit alpha [bacterium]HPP08605.1 acetyl-CoA carboxylase carboxyltransferase subunit alpha [bacterium]